MEVDTAQGEEYNALVQKKSQIEEELAELNEVLKSENNVGMNGNLVDSEGYPRADIDIYKVRLTRQRVNCLRNDYLEVMDQIHKHLEKALPSEAAVSRNTAALLARQESSSGRTALKAFIKISTVEPGSPSYEAGVRPNDEILQLGPFTHENTSKSLGDLAEYVQKHQDKIILVRIARSAADQDQQQQQQQDAKQTMIIKLVPKKWHGMGLLGCKLNYIG